ncbi:zinc ABC transporter substrate-binding protein [Alloalcanivorax gelatiniphagus]
MISTHPLRTVAVLSVATLALAGCGDGAGSGAEGDAGLSIVASTNVYGDVAAAVAGDLASVTSVITSSSQDPHEYEASAQDRLTFDDADLVIENGGGYDSFVDTLLEGGSGDPVVLNAVDVSGLSPEEGEEAHAEEEHAEEEGHSEEGHSEEEGHEDGHEDHGHIEGFNEHVWYDFHAMEKVAEEISHELGELDPDNASTFEANYEDFVAQLETLEVSAEDVRAAAEGRHVMITEPVPVYLLAEVGLDNLTPAEFSEAVEEGADVPPRVLQETLDLFTDEDIAVLAYNSQAADATTEEVLATAEGAGVPVVEFSETLPEGMSYLEWQQANLDALAEALG